MVLTLIILVFVNTHDHGQVFIFCRCGNQHLFSAGFPVSYCLGGIGKASGRLNNDVNTVIAPRDILRIAFGKCLYLFAVNNNGIGTSLYFAGEGTVGAVPFQQVSIGPGISQVVNSGYFQLVTVVLEYCSQG